MSSDNPRSYLKDSRTTPGSVAGAGASRYGGQVTQPLRFPDKYFELFPQAHRLPTEALMNMIHVTRLVTERYERTARSEGLPVSGAEPLPLLAVADGPL